jgi:hypothetical protein
VLEAYWVTDGRQSTCVKRESVTPEFLAKLRRAPHGPWIDALIEEIEKCWARQALMIEGLRRAEKVD